MEQYHITIPETPVSMLSRSNSAEASRPPFPVPGSNDGGPASGTNLDAKNKRWDKPRSPATASCSPAQQRRSVTYEILSKSSSAEASSPPPPVSSSDEGSPASSANRDAKTKRIAEPPSLGQQKRQSSESRSPTGSETLLRSGLRSKSEEVARVFITSDRAAEEQSAASGTLDTSAIDQAYNLESNHHELEDTDDEESAAGERPGAWRLQPTRDQKATNTDSLAPNMTVRLDSSRFKPKAGQYNNRQLAGMALLAAGRPCSALQVQNWVAENFPGYRKGKGAWERSLQASLAGRDDFRAIVSLGDRFRLYYFAHPASRKPYEELFSDYTANETASEERPTETPPVRTVTAITPEASIAAQSDVLRDVTIEGATGITTTEPPGDKPSNGSGNSTGPELPILAPPGESTLAASHLTYLGVLSISEENISHDFDGIFMPFERADMFHPIEDRDPPGTRREASFSKAFPELARPSIATMSDADIKKKIEEIKSRPSRKAKWGKRLAFARLHRQDVHDETDGAWKPRFPVETRHQNAEDGDDDVQDSAENLKDIFDMPKNPILILHNDQLAFRDGTLINGKLPRSRVVYKVGRKFGGENGDLRL
ncbi:hypothetical protein K458DRAFT_10977 [Lentithecium fluviatile CBS 122367]|uniref:Fork-head domain-containing protein n=1 Tax=Lentithecium fluviatile CBS 122367 TaxID=1168545 RepID=A0A6G1JPU5_9PLEO|nr:hypothetical protein K458DRAFT_10977 [Lentithecium fluviatile CBS 122367]